MKKELFEKFFDKISDLNPKLDNLLIVGLGGILAYKLFKKFKNNKKEENEEEIPFIDVEFNNLENNKIDELEDELIGEQVTFSLDDNENE